MSTVEYLPFEKRKELVEIARKIVASGKGILAADESTGKYFRILEMVSSNFINAAGLCNCRHTILTHIVV